MGPSPAGPRRQPRGSRPLPKPQFPHLRCCAQLWTPRKAEAGSRTLGTEVQAAPPGGAPAAEGAARPSPWPPGAQLPRDGPSLRPSPQLP